MSSTYFTIYDMPNPKSIDKRLVAVCYHEEQARVCYERIMRSNVGMSYVVLERVDTNTIGLIVGRMVIAEEWANRSRD
jgi:hypothetical protein